MPPRAVSVPVPLALTGSATPAAKSSRGPECSPAPVRTRTPLVASHRVSTGSWSTTKTGHCSTWSHAPKTADVTVRTNYEGAGRRQCPSK